MPPQSLPSSKNARIRARGYFGAPLGFSKLLLGASAGPKGPPRKGKTLRLRSFPLRSSRGTGSLHFYKGLCLPKASYPLKMQGFWPSHGTLRKCRDSGLRPSWGHPRLTSNQKTASSKKPLNLEAFLGERFGCHRGGHGTP